MDKKENVEFTGQGNVATIHEWSPVDETGRHKNSTEIEQDIEETRHSMDLILDALSGKGSPGALYNRAQDYLQNATNRENIKHTLSKIGGNISGSFQRNPLPVMMITAGASWMLWETQRQGTEPSHDGKSSEKIRREAEDRLNNVKGESSQKIEQAKQRAAEFSDTARGKTEELSVAAKEKARSFLGGARYRGNQYRQRAEKLQDSAKYSYKKADTAVHNNPLIFGAAAAFAGLIAGLMLPETSEEKRYAGEKSGEMLQRAEETGKEFAREAEQTASGKAKEQGISPEQLSQKAKETLHGTTDTVSNKAKEEKTSEQVSIRKEQKPVAPGDIGTKPV